MCAMTSTREPQTAVRRPASGVNIDPKKLIRLRELKAWSRAELADAVGMSRDAIAKIENSARRPKSSTLRKLCDALSCQPVDLLRDGTDAGEETGIPGGGTPGDDTHDDGTPGVASTSDKDENVLTSA